MSLVNANKLCLQKLIDSSLSSCRIYYLEHHRSRLGQNPVHDSGGSQQKGAGSVFQGGGSQITHTEQSHMKAIC